MVDIASLKSFKLKKIEIFQSDQGMKVSLDALIFAAYVGKKWKNALDIGAGTGVLSLILAQDSKAHIDAVEIDPYIADICQYNFEVSAYKDRLNLYQSSFDDFINKNASKKYDLIISNPPFLKMT